MKTCSLFIVAALFYCMPSYGQELTAGFINFKTCVEQSQQGQKEKKTLDALKQQMHESLEKTDTELTEISKNLEDEEHMETLSAEAKEELQQQFQSLSQEFAQYQSQYYQLLNQANYKMLQILHEQVSKAAEVIREQHQLSLMLNEDSVFASAPALDFTDEVISELNLSFQKEQKEVVQLTEERKENE